MAVYISPIGGAGWQFFDDNGVPLSGGKLYTYAAGTTTPAVTYTSSSGITPHTNPIIFNAAGRVPTGEIWLTFAAYKFVLYTSANVLIASYDNIRGNGANAAALNNFTGTGSQTVFALSAAPYNENSTNVYINGVYQQKNTYAISGVSVIFSAPPPVTSTIEVMYN